MDIYEKKELILRSFSEAFDKDMAYKKVGLTDLERETLEHDTEFQDRLDLCLINEREKIIRKLNNFSVSENDQVAFKATIELGKILYPSFFDNLKDETKVNVNVNVKTKEEEDRIDEEYSILLGKNSSAGPSKRPS